MYQGYSIERHGVRVQTAAAKALETAGYDWAPQLIEARVSWSSRMQLGTGIKTSFRACVYMSADQVIVIRWRTAVSHGSACATVNPFRHRHAAITCTNDRMLAVSPSFPRWPYGHKAERPCARTFMAPRPTCAVGGLLTGIRGMNRDPAARPARCVPRAAGTVARQRHERAAPR